MQTQPSPYGIYHKGKVCLARDAACCLVRDGGAAGSAQAFIMEDSAIVTAACIDDNFIILGACPTPSTPFTRAFAGDSNGTVSLRERRTGTLLYYLNRY